MSEVVLAASQCRTTISETIQTMALDATLSGSNAFGCDSTTPTKMVQSITTDNNTGVITVVPHQTNLGVDLTSTPGSITLQPLKDSASNPYALATATTGGQTTQVYEWKCKSTGNTAKYAPGSCK
jgi:type IV pilus assembly protein PilA